VQRPRDRIAKLQNYIVENALIIIFATCRRIGIRAQKSTRARLLDKYYRVINPIVIVSHAACVYEYLRSGTRLLIPVMTHINAAQLLRPDLRYDTLYLSSGETVSFKGDAHLKRREFADGNP